MSKLVVGQVVRCEREAPSKGTWPRYAGRVGRIVTINPLDREYGVSFTIGHDAVLNGQGAEVWFLASELVPVDRSQRVRAARQGVETTVGGHP